ncbi:Flagellar biosynthesis protein FliR [Methylophaga frappieri]|uniref:Flagellar biosynthetic protein FliR n=2 Tax=Methylophaga frappieri (strain ATCC BAA-2434 / DSM 25690 / JAM7) TaxID=754477 RepID=I1YHL6_METFJ|nr:Flagellar biosynthesis protein FliR [Methylophaga frappieri]
MWPFIRIAAMVMAAPIFSANYINTRSRLLLALVITFVVVPTISTPMPQVFILSSSGLLLLLQQVLIGISIGFMLQLMFNAFIVAGQIIAMQMGLGFASLVDPQNGLNVPVISQFYLIFTSLLFVSLNGHLILIQVLAESFITMPVGSTGLQITHFHDIALLGSWLYAAAILIALPAIGSLTMVNLAFGILSRAAPQISPFTIGFPMTIVLGFAIMFFTLPLVGQHLLALSDEMLQMIRSLVTSG